MEAVAWRPDQVEEFLLGRRTLGELEGVSKEQQLEIAETGFRFLGQGKLKQAKTIFEGLFALDPDDAYFALALGAIAHRQGEVLMAERMYGLSIARNPYSASAHANRGELRLSAGDRDAARADLKRAIELDPQAEEPATARAKVLLAHA